ncbi:MAG: DUF5615 family PIN-like protein [Chloroflexi bacterium]|nr:DUF5615 family PIN-like protein [Chloroflexota bacterium]
MILWLDAHLSPRLVPWIQARFGVQCQSVIDMGLHTAKDSRICSLAREAASVVVTKDADFVRLLRAQGPTPQVLWIRCGNTSNSSLRSILEAALPPALQLLERGEPLVEVRDATLV